MSDNLDNKKVMANNIKYYMELNNIDRKTLCQALGFKYTTLSDWLNAKTYPRIDKIEEMANYFGISKADLVEPKEPTIEPSPQAYVPETIAAHFEGQEFTEEDLADISKFLDYVASRKKP